MQNTSAAHRYAVAFDSVLGIQIKNYITRCVNADTAARDFAECRAQLYGLTCIDTSTELVFSDDCEAGGLLGFSIPKTAFDELSTDMRVAVLWDSLPDDSRPSNLIVFPRCERQTHFIRYGKAVDLRAIDNGDWEFVLAPHSRKDAPDAAPRIKVFTYEEVRRIISREDANALVKKAGETPAASIKLAQGRQYVINTDTLPSHMHIAVSTYRQEAIDLFREMQSLPNVPALSLAKTLQLGTITDKSFRDRCFCRWEVDEPNHRYIITTGLTSSRPDMVQLDDETL